MIQKIKDFLFPEVDKEVQHHIDIESLYSLNNLSAAIIVFELLALSAYLITRYPYGLAERVSIGSVLFCVFTCGVIFLLTDRMDKNKELDHTTVTAFKMFFVLVLSAWAIWVSWRHYNIDDQLLTFFIVQLMMVCFIPFKPWGSILITLFIYGALFSVLYSIDQAANVNIFNYIVLVLASISGMAVRYFSQVKLSTNAVSLQKKNDELEYLNHHDVLTGLRNRLALNEDADTLSGSHIDAFMIDIDYFKEFNDKYGHSAGDAALIETARTLRTLFPKSYCYRYGGDEFVVLSANGDIYKEDSYHFTIPSLNDLGIQLSIGRAEGTPKDRDKVFDLISAADGKLYEVKKRTHSPEFGGHERRQSM